MASFGNGFSHDGPYAIVDTETTGFSPQLGDRIIEVAVTRIDREGKVEGEFCTLLNPGDRDVGPVFVHGITNDAVRHAPEFPEIADDIAAWLEGAVVVAHNAAFDEKFLSAEFDQAGTSVGMMPGLCSLWLSRQTVALPNYKLATVAGHFGTANPASHSALGDVRVLAATLPRLLDGQPKGIRYPVESRPVRMETRLPARMVTRAGGLRRGVEGWMPNLIARLPLDGMEASDEMAIAYAEALAHALEDGRLVGDEMRTLAHIAGQGGLGANQVRDLNGAFLEGLREAAFADDILTARELHELTRAAAALGSPEYFDDLAPSQRSNARLDMPAKASSQAGTASGTRQRRCSHCHQAGHYKPRCPELQ